MEVLCDRFDLRVGNFAGPDSENRPAITERSTGTGYDKGCSAPNVGFVGIAS